MYLEKLRYDIKEIHCNLKFEKVFAGRLCKASR